MSNQEQEQNEMLQPTPAEEPTEQERQKQEKRDAKAERRLLHDRRRLRYGGVATAITVCVIVGVILLNVIMGTLNDRFPLNLDLTADKLLTMTEQSEEFIRSIDKEVEIVVCAPEDTFLSPTTENTEYNNLLLQFYRALGQYQTLSGGKVTHTFVDLTNDPTQAAKYQQYGVQNNDILFLSGDRSHVSKLSDTFTYDEMSYYYYGQLVLQESNVEQVLALGVQHVVGTDLPTITLLTGHGENATLLTNVKKLFGDLGYEFAEKNITTTEEFPAESDVMMIAAPSEDYTAEELKDLRDWVDNGGKRGRKVIFLANWDATCPNLEEYFRDDFGVAITHDMLVETSAARVPTNYRAQQGFVAYADIADTACTSAAERGMLLAYCLRLLPQWEDDTTKSQYTQVVATMPDSAQLIDLSSEDADHEPRPADAYPVAGMVLSTASTYTDGATVSSQALVSGSYMFLTLDDKSDKAFTEMINAMTGNESLQTMPSKKLTAAKAEFENQATANFLGFGVFTVGLPLALIVIGIVVYIKRKRL